MKPLFSALLLLILTSTSASAVTIRTDEANGAVTWTTKADGVHISLTQLLPDQLRAFYVNRGFSLEQAEPFAQSCVYMVVIRNDSAPGVIQYTLSNWSIETDNETRSLTPATDWMDRFKSNGVSQSSIIAFRWAQIPPEQEYRPGGDWNQGMLSIGLNAGSQFDLIAKWNILGYAYESQLTGVKCAKE